MDFSLGRLMLLIQSIIPTESHLTVQVCNYTINQNILPSLDLQRLDGEQKKKKNSSTKLLIM